MSTLSRTLIQGSRARRLEHVAGRAGRVCVLSLWMSTKPSTSPSSPAAMLRRVVFPQPDGPRRQQNWPTGTVNCRFSIAVCGGVPAISCEALAADVDGQSCCQRHRVHRRSSGAHDTIFDRHHHHDERERIGENCSDVEQLEEFMELEADAVAPAQQAPPPARSSRSGRCRRARRP